MNLIDSILFLGVCCSLFVLYEQSGGSVPKRAICLIASVLGMGVLLWTLSLSPSDWLIWPIGVYAVVNAVGFLVPTALRIRQMRRRAAAARAEWDRSH